MHPLIPLKSSPVSERSAYPMHNCVCLSPLTSGLESFGHKSTPLTSPGLRIKVLHSHIKAPKWNLKRPLATYQSGMPSLFILVAAMGKYKQINNFNNIREWCHLINYLWQKLHNFANPKLPTLRLLVCQRKELHWTHADTVREVRPLKHEERTVVWHTALAWMEVRVHQDSNRELADTGLLM